MPLTAEENESGHQGRPWDPQGSVLTGKMPDSIFELVADVSSDNLPLIEAALHDMDGATITTTTNGFHVVAQMTGESTQDCNRRLLSALRRVERRTRLRAELTQGNTTTRFFDYVQKGTRTTEQAPPD